MANTNRSQETDKKEPQSPPSELKQTTESKHGDDALEPKQGVITPADTRGDSPKKLRAIGFKGSYKGVMFDDEGVSQTPVPAAVQAELQLQYPGLVIEEIK